MPTFKIAWEIELEAKNPLEAAKEAQRWIAGNDWQYEEDENAVIPTEKYGPLIENKQ